ncbi:MAG: transcription elongation factor Spt5 [Thermoplasmatota archaeon]
MGLLEDFEEEEVEEKEEKKVKEKEELLGLHLECDDKYKSVTTGSNVTYDVDIVNDTGESQEIEIKGHLIYSTDEDERIPWDVHLLDKKSFSEGNEIIKKEIELENRKSKKITVEVEVPEGASYGEKLEVIIDATSTKDTLLSDSITLITTARPTIVAVKTQIGQEKKVADYIAALSDKSNLGVFSILSPKPLRGYIFMEVMSPHRIEDAISSMRRAKGLVKGETEFEEIEHFLAPKLAVEGIAEGDIVELSAGPFKGEKARVTQIDEANDEITVELFEATVPIPVTVRGDHVRVLEKEK